MKLSRFLILISILSSIVFGQNPEQITQVSDTFKVSSNNEYRLSRVAVYSNTIRVSAGENWLEKSGYEYKPEEQSVIFKTDTDLAPDKSIVIFYQTLKLNLKSSYQKNTLVEKTIEEKKVLQVATVKTPITVDDLFGKQITKSGTLSRGFTVSTNKEFTVNSGLRLELSGKLSEDLEIVAALTDENLPFQPEGNTERLEELDKVFIQVKHPNFIGTFGDYEVNQSQSVFGKYSRKLQGLKVTSNFKNSSASIAVASSRGKFHTNNFYGTDGMQGPYRLRGKNNERELIIISGTEKVYIDGRQIKRGEANDYTIDYSTAEIIFTAKTLITSATRITIDFEYTDRKYERNFFATEFNTSLFYDKLLIGVNYAREGDNHDSPIDFELSDEERTVLQEAGFDRLEAFTSGVILVEPDSAGIRNGSYIKIDSLISGEEVVIYQYSPNDDEASYNVYFSYIAEGAGDYVKETLGNYKYVGKGQGQYLPIRLIPLPELVQTSNLYFESKPFENLNIKFELAGSLQDKNRLSDIENDISGFATNIGINYTGKEISLFGNSLHLLNLSYNERFVKDTFNPLDRINSVEFTRDYNIENINQTGDETFREIGVDLQPFEQLKFKGLYGYLKSSELLESERVNGSVELSAASAYMAKYDYDITKTENGIVNSDWSKQKAEAFYLFSSIKPGISFSQENKKTILSSDSLTSNSHLYNEFIPFLEFNNGNGISISASYSFREESFPIAGKMKKQSDARLQTYSIEYTGLKEFNTALDVVVRNKKISDEFSARGFEDTKSVLVRNQSRMNLFGGFLSGNFYYETSTQQSARREKVFIKVQQGTGNYKYIGDINENGIAEENEFELTLFDGDHILTTIPTEELFPVIDLKSSLRFNLNFKNILSKRHRFYKYLELLSTETYFRVEENSRIEDIQKIYLLDFDYFRNDSTTVRGSEYFQQDFYINKNSRKLSLRYRYKQRKNLQQYSAGTEDAFLRENSLKLRFRLVTEIGIEADYINRTDNLLAPATSNRSRQLNAEELSGDFSYRPSRSVEAGFKVKIGKVEDGFPDTPTIIDENSQSLRLSLNIMKKGRLKLELERTELVANTGDNYIPFEVSKGNSIGKNYFFRLNFDYSISSFIQTVASYNARKHGDSDIIHAMRAEVKAYF